MKKFMALVLALVLCLSFAGCSLFSTDEETEVANYEPIPVTDSYTHEDPADIDFSVRYALTSGKNPADLEQSFMEYYGVDWDEQITIVYADGDDHAVYQVTYYVFATPEDAVAFAEAAAFDSSCVQDNMVIDILDEEGVNTIIQIDQMFGSIEEDTASDYVDSMREIDGYMDIQ